MEEEERAHFKSLGYDVTGKLGEGDFCPVFRAQCDDRVTVALPVEPNEPTDDLEYDSERQIHVKRVCLGGMVCAIKRDNSRISRNNERAAMLVMNHYCIARIYDTIDYNYKYYIVMEYMNTRMTLKEYLNSLTCPLDQFTALVIIKHIVLALQHVHSKGYAHQDMHDNNLMMNYTADGRVVCKLVDFGTATRHDQGGYSPKKDLDQLRARIMQILSKTNISGDIRNQIMVEVNNIESGRLKTMDDIARHLLPLLPQSDNPPEGSAAELLVKTADQ